ncbi:hypothetical protein [Ectothiorhodospira shaposhnikovii]|uniref:hypothetical protein n=1 Tax=Ectothiorhodospira shaposhnikovii TaxID=1054 RepID=UPI0039A041F7
MHRVTDNLRRTWRRLQRRFLLRQLSRQRPETLRALSRRRLEQCFTRAATGSPAYGTLLREAGLNTHPMKAEAILRDAPLLDKGNTFGRFPLQALMIEGTPPQTLGGILTSSGHGGDRFAFGLTTHRQMATGPDAIDLGLQMAFGVDDHSTLLVNCLPMGVVFNSRTVCVANVSVREDMALAIIRQASPLFDQVILCTDPLFLKRLLDHAAEQGFDWSQVRLQAILGEETFSEDFRSYAGARLGIDPDTPEGPMIGSSMGVGELGLNLFFETRETIAARRALHRRQPLHPPPFFFCYNPLRTLVEIHAPDDNGNGELVVTVLDPQATIPLIRYRTGDTARWPRAEDFSDLPCPVAEALQHGPLPMIALQGRAKDRIGSGWRVDHFKSLLYRDPRVADCVSGAFRVDPQAQQWEVQVRSGLATPSPAEVADRLQALVHAEAVDRQRPPPRVRCYPHEDFPYGMGLDYERKFTYLPRA